MGLPRPLRTSSTGGWLPGTQSIRRSLEHAKRYSTGTRSSGRRRSFFCGPAQRTFSGFLQASGLGEPDNSRLGAARTACLGIPWQLEPSKSRRAAAADERSQWVFQTFDLVIEASQGKYRASVNNLPGRRSPSSHSRCPVLRPLSDSCCTSAPGSPAWTWRGGRCRARRSWKLLHSARMRQRNLATCCSRRCFPARSCLAWFRSERLARAEGAGIRLRLRVDASSIAQLPGSCSTIGDQGALSHYLRGDPGSAPASRRVSRLALWRYAVRLTFLYWSALLQGLSRPSHGTRSGSLSSGPLVAGSPAAGHAWTCCSSRRWSRLADGCATRRCTLSISSDMAATTRDLGVLSFFAIRRAAEWA